MPKTRSLIGWWELAGVGMAAAFLVTRKEYVSGHLPCIMF